MELRMEKVRFVGTFNITRPDCWTGAFKGKGAFNTKVTEIVTLNGTEFTNGDIVFVLHNPGIRPKIYIALFPAQLPGEISFSYYPDANKKIFFYSSLQYMKCQNICNVW